MLSLTSINTKDNDDIKFAYQRAGLPSRVFQFMAVEIFMVFVVRIGYRNLIFIFKEINSSARNEL